MLLFLFVDYSRDPELRARFSTNPKEVLKEYGLLEDPRAALLAASDEPQDLEKALLEDIRYILQDESPPHSMYLQPTSPNIRLMDPARGPIDTDIPVVLEGSYFEPEATLEFTRPKRDSVFASKVEVPNFNTLTATISFKEVGPYTVKVTNPNGGFGTLPLAFTATN